MLKVWKQNVAALPEWENTLFFPTCIPQADRDSLILIMLF